MSQYRTYSVKSTNLLPTLLQSQDIQCVQQPFVLLWFELSKSIKAAIVKALQLLCFFILCFKLSLLFFPLTKQQTTRKSKPKLFKLSTLISYWKIKHCSAWAELNTIIGLSTTAIVLFNCCFISIVKKRKVCVRMRTKTCQEGEDERMIQQVGIHKNHKKIPPFSLIIITSVSYNFNTK